jgi:hypothetical protein
VAWRCQPKDDPSKVIDNWEVRLAIIFFSFDAIDTNTSRFNLSKDVSRQGKRTTR